MLTLTKLIKYIKKDHNVSYQSDYNIYLLINTNQSGIKIYSKLDISNIKYAYTNNVHKYIEMNNEWFKLNNDMYTFYCYKKTLYITDAYVIHKYE